MSNYIDGQELGKYTPPPAWSDTCNLDQHSFFLNLQNYRFPLIYPTSPLKSRQTSYKSVISCASYSSFKTAQKNETCRLVSHSRLVRYLTLDRRWIVEIIEWCLRTLMRYMCDRNWTNGYLRLQINIMMNSTNCPVTETFFVRDTPHRHLSKIITSDIIINFMDHACSSGFSIRM